MLHTELLIVCENPVGHRNRCPPKSTTLEANFKTLPACIREVLTLRPYKEKLSVCAVNINYRAPAAALTKQAAFSLEGKGTGGFKT